MSGDNLGGSERELVLPPNTHAFILNNQKGDVEVFVGPHKSNLDAKTDQPVIFDYKLKKFEHVNHLTKAIRTNTTAPEGWYLALKNPAKDDRHPIVGAQSEKTILLIGKKINIKGPASFALFPGQMCKVIKGHHLRSNQYLIVRIYDKAEAIAAGVTHDISASQTIIDTTKTGEDGKDGKDSKDETTTLDSAKKKDESVAGTSREVEVGQLMIIKGTERSFYMPPTGVEVVSVKGKEGSPEYDNSGNTKTRYVQDAVTLERLEYCVLLDEDGKKEYRMGPDVVFPKPTQEFIEKNGSRKFKAMGLNEISGIYIMVTNKYETNGEVHKPGDELFITGKDTRIYYPREEHAIVKYDENEIHFATAVPEGEGRYVMDRAKGEIATEKGPQMLLPDPRTHVMIRRILTRKQVEQWFPGNIEAIKYNQELEVSNKESSDSGEIGYVSDANFRTSRRKQSMSFDEMGLDNSRGGELFASASKGFTGDSIQKKQTYTKPRTVTIDTKFEGAVRINVYQGYAVAVESKSGGGKIVVGPKQFLLDYHENLVSVGLSKQTPKSKDDLYFTPYLRVLNNKVSDLVSAETKDHVEVEVLLSYIIDFTGDEKKWFDVENYVLFATERLGSMVRNMIKQFGIEYFYVNGIVLIRDLVLGKSEVVLAKESYATKIAVAREIATVAKKSEAEGSEAADIEDWTEIKEIDYTKLSSDRPGRPFKENGMKVSDVEIQEINVGDEAIADLLTNSQTAVVEQALDLEKLERTADYVESQQSLQRRSNKAVHITTVERLGNEGEVSTGQLELNLKKAKELSDVTKQNLEEEKSQQVIKDAISTLTRAVKKAEDDQKLKTDTDQAALESTKIEACTKAFVEKFKSITPDLIAAMEANGDKQLALGMAQHLGPKAILGGGSLADVMNSILKGTVLDGLDLTKKIEQIVEKELDERDEEY